MVKKRIIVGNWKMNPGSLEEAKEIFIKIKRKAAGFRRVETVVCPPDLHVVTLAKLAEGSSVSVGVQDVFGETVGSFTGQISPKMARDAGARFAIVGHSESRKMGVTNAEVAKKVAAVIENKMTAILCVGEEFRDQEGNYLTFLREQLLGSLAGMTAENLGKGLVVAYEPVWEVGRKDMKTMKPEDLRQTAIFIKKVLNDAFGEKVASRPLLYGGSVSAENTALVIRDGGVSGLLVGRQSLVPEAFIEILKIADETK